jgi:hypothetical protein
VALGDSRTSELQDTGTQFGPLKVLASYGTLGHDSFTRHSDGTLQKRNEFIQALQNVGHFPAKIHMMVHGLLALTVSGFGSSSSSIYQLMDCSKV